MTSTTRTILSIVAFLASYAIASCGPTVSSSCPPGPDPFEACDLAGSCDPNWNRPTTDEPCDYPHQCAPGLACDFAAPPPSGEHCGTCRSDGICPPPASPYGCRNASEPGNLPACPPYVGKGTQGSGCQWAAECAAGFTCDLAAPQAGYCGSCKGPPDGGIAWPF